MRVPPDQSGISAAARSRARSGLAVTQRASQPSEPRTEHEHLCVCAGCHAPEQVQVRAGVRLHRPGDVEQRDHAARRPFAGTPDRYRWVAARARAVTQRSAQIEPVTTTMPAPAPGQPQRWIDRHHPQQRGQGAELVRRQPREVDLGQSLVPARERRYWSADSSPSVLSGPSNRSVDRTAVPRDSSPSSGSLC